jgi:hypothetical protein
MALADCWLLQYRKITNPLHPPPYTAVIESARLSDKPISPATATAAIVLFKTGGPKAVKTQQGGATRRRRLLEEAGTDAVSSLQGMLEALGQVAEMMAKGVTPADAYVPAGDAGNFVSAAGVVD